MSKYLNSLVVGIDVASEFSFAAVLAPDGSQYRKPFKIFHTVDGFKYLIKHCFVMLSRVATINFKLYFCDFLGSIGLFFFNPCFHKLLYTTYKLYYFHRLQNTPQQS